ncbi:MAG: hypothetical protein JSW61_00040 [Candidatus Thorarchaeota archaeon]|nr:MAG: hypothetical protein JSW61_00040 [Candidatus Thorarchaeota archaeon]
MNEEDTVDQLSDIIRLIDDIKQAIQQNHTKFQVALANSLRLFSNGADGTLSKLHGTEEDLMSYLLKLARSLQQETESQIESLRSMLSEIIRNTRNS